MDPRSFVFDPTGNHGFVNLKPSAGDLLGIVQVGNYILPPCRATLARTFRDDNSERETARGERLSARSTETTKDAQPDVLAEWVLVWYCDTEPAWWAVTVTILVLDEVLRSGTGARASRIRELLAELRGLRDMLNHLEKSKSCLPFPLIPFLAEPDGTLNLRISKEYAENILSRRFRHTVCGKTGVLRADQALHGYLGESLRNNVKLAVVTWMFISDEEKGKLQDYANKICALADDALILDCVAQLPNKVEVLSRLCFHGMGNTPSRAAYAEVEGAVTKGGFGEVFKVETRLWGNLAYKREFKVRIEPDTEDLIEFHRIVGLVPHPNILPIFGFRNKEGEIVSVMPWAENGTLEDYLRRHPSSDRRHLLHGVASALAHLHDSKMVHGDIHMKNILISSDGDALLCDFGLSKKLEEDGLGDVLDYSSMPEGVPVYIAPERHRGKPRSRESDVFAFGMLCHQTYSGTRPMVQCQNAMATIIALSHGERPSRSEVTRSDFTDQMWKLVQTCWAQKPEERPAMETVERLLREMHTAEELHALAEQGVRVTLRIVSTKDAAPEEDDAIQRTAQALRPSMRVIERVGLKSFTTASMGRPRDSSPPTNILHMEKRAIDPWFLRHDHGCMIS